MFFILTVQANDKGPGNLSDQATVVIVLTGTTSINDNPLDLSQNDINIYPNPATCAVILELSNNSFDPISITIYDKHGALVYKYENNNTGSNIEKEIQVSDWSNGVYIVNAIVGNRGFQKKIIKI